MTWIYRYIGGPLHRGDYRYLLFLVLMTWISTMGWLLAAGAL